MIRQVFLDLSYPLVMTNSLLLKMAMDSSLIYPLNMVFFYSYVNVYQKVPVQYLHHFSPLSAFVWTFAGDLCCVFKPRWETWTSRSRSALWKWFNPWGRIRDFPEIGVPRARWMMLDGFQWTIASYRIVRNGWWLGVPLFQETSIWSVGNGILST